MPSKKSVPLKSSKVSEIKYMKCAYERVFVSAEISVKAFMFLNIESNSLARIIYCHARSLKSNCTEIENMYEALLLLAYTLWVCE